VTISFGAFTLDTHARQLVRGGRSVHLSPKALALLTALVDARPRALSKSELQETLWPDTFVAEANLSNLAAEVRAAIDDRARVPRFIRTVHGFGYAFCGEATTTADSAVGSATPVCSLDWGQREFLLCAGEYVIGRHASADIRLNASTVSRRHARLSIGSGAVRLSDLGSKNGTFCGADLVSGPIHLADGDIVRIGSLALTVHLHGPGATTATARRGSSRARRR
jgi:DNA-binding winged helix-turn-helix (wHTH) protein